MSTQESGIFPADAAGWADLPQLARGREQLALSWLSAWFRGPGRSFGTSARTGGDGKGRDSLLFGNGIRLRSSVRFTRRVVRVCRSQVPEARPTCERITPHDLRHTTASWPSALAPTVKAVQRMLGHASATITLDTYADLFDDDLDAVALAHDHAGSQAQDVGKRGIAGKGNAPDPLQLLGSGAFHLAVPVGFEPTVRFHAHNFSRVAPSAARTRYRE